MARCQLANSSLVGQSVFSVKTGERVKNGAQAGSENRAPAMPAKLKNYKC